MLKFAKPPSSRESVIAYRDLLNSLPAYAPSLPNYAGKRFIMVEYIKFHPEYHSDQFAVVEEKSLANFAEKWKIVSN